MRADTEAHPGGAQGPVVLKAGGALLVQLPWRMRPHGLLLAPFETHALTHVRSACS
jgi:hypothetical protein